jgi:cell wall assembly regulator SMI1
MSRNQISMTGTAALNGYMVGDVTNAPSVPPVETSWVRILSWLNGHVPGYKQGLDLPATFVQIQRVEQETGIELPGDLRAWWQIFGGFSDRSTRLAGSLLPTAYNPCSPQDALVRRQTGIQARVQLVSSFPEGFDRDFAEQERKPAGSPYQVWLDNWLPIATSTSGDALFADLRPGPLRGCIMDFRPDFGSSRHPIWSSIAEMLHQVAEALQQRTPLQNTVPVVIDGRLEWSLT